MDYEKLTDRELVRSCRRTRLLPYQFKRKLDDNAARLVRDRIAELKVVPQYRHYLAKQIWPEDTPFDQFKGAYEFAFLFEQATPRQQVIAALRTLDRAEKGGSGSAE